MCRDAGRLVMLMAIQMSAAWKYCSYTFAKDEICDGARTPRNQAVKVLAKISKAARHQSEWEHLFMPTNIDQLRR